MDAAISLTRRNTKPLYSYSVFVIQNSVEDTKLLLLLLLLLPIILLFQIIIVSFVDPGGRVL
jgi:hypothetical protein